MQSDWRQRLRREMSWLLLAKLAALILLWALFFSPSHRTPADPGSTAQRLSLTPGSAAPRVPIEPQE